MTKIPWTEEKKKALKKFLLKLGLSILVIAAILIPLYFVLKHFGLTDITSEQIQEFVSGFGVWGPVIFIIISFLQVTFIPIPSTVTILAGNVLFGSVWLSFIYSYIGIVLGSVFAFFLGRVIGKPFVGWLVGGQDKVDAWLKKFKGKEVVVMVFMFIFPFFPDDFICALGGILPIGYISFTIIQLLTRPISIFGNLLFLSGEYIPYTEPWGIALIIVLCILAIAAAVLCFIYSEQLMKLFDRFTTWVNEKIFRKKQAEEIKTEEKEEK